MTWCTRTAATVACLTLVVIVGGGCAKHTGLEEILAERIDEYVPPGVTVHQAPSDMEANWKIHYSSQDWSFFATSDTDVETAAEALRNQAIKEGWEPSGDFKETDGSGERTPGRWYAQLYKDQMSLYLEYRTSAADYSQLQVDAQIMYDG